MTGSSPLADWLKACRKLAPDSDGMQAIARILGLRHDLAGPAVERGANRRKPLTPPDTGSAAGPPASAQPEPRYRRRLDSVLTPANASRNPAPLWLATVRQLEQAEPDGPEYALPLDPLFPAHLTRCLLSDATSTLSPIGPLEVSCLIEKISRAVAVRELPRHPIPTLVRGVQLLVDRSEGMQLFAADQAFLRAELLRVVGRDRTKVLYFEGSPLDGTGTGPKEDWPDYRPEAPGTPVVALTDLGIAPTTGATVAAGPGEWLAFAHRLSLAHCPFLAMVPYPPSRWPAALARKLTIIQWDRATTSSVVRRTIGAGLRPEEAFG
jgi:hypothetical protein